MDELAAIGIKVNFGIYWTSGKTIQFDYPFEFEALPTEIATLATSDGTQPYNLIAVGTANLDKSDFYRIVTFKQPSANTVDVKISLHATGTYKRGEAAQ